MGVPVIAMAGVTFAGRHSASHVTNAGLAADWLADDEDGYVALAGRRAGDREGLARLRAGLREKVRTSPLCDGPRFAANLDAAYRDMWRRWCATQGA